MSWTQQAEDYLDEMIKKCQKQQQLHYLSEKHYTNRNILLTILILSLTNLTGTLTLVTSNNPNNFEINIAMGIVLYISSLLTAVQKFVNFDTLSVRHKEVFKKYTALEQYIFSQKLKDKEHRKELSDFQDELTNQIKEITDSLPAYPTSVMKLIEKPFNNLV